MPETVIAVGLLIREARRIDARTINGLRALDALRQRVVSGMHPLVGVNWDATMGIAAESGPWRTTNVRVDIHPVVWRERVWPELFAAAKRQS